MKKLFNSFLSALVLILISAPATVHAAIWSDFGSANNFGEYASLIFAWTTPILGIIAFLMVIYAGYIFMTSEGNPQQVTTAKDILTGVIVGIILYFTAELLLRNVIGTKYF